MNLFETYAVPENDTTIPVVLRLLYAKYRNIVRDQLNSAYTHFDLISQSISNLCPNGTISSSPKAVKGLIDLMEKNGQDVTLLANSLEKVIHTFKFEVKEVDLETAYAVKNKCEDEMAKDIFAFEVAILHLKSNMRVQASKTLVHYENNTTIIASLIKEVKELRALVNGLEDAHKVGLGDLGVFMECNTALSTLIGSMREENIQIQNELKQLTIKVQEAQALLSKPQTQEVPTARLTTDIKVADRNNASMPFVVLPQQQVTVARSNLSNGQAVSLNRPLVQSGTFRPQYGVQAPQTVSTYQGSLFYRPQVNNSQAPVVLHSVIPSQFKK